MRQLSGSAVTIAAAAAAVIGAAAVTAFWRRGRKSAVAPEGYEKITLNENEVTAGLIGNPAVCTQTYYKGSLKDAEEYFRQRYQEILAANPWMAGRLVYDHGTPVIVAPVQFTDELMSAGEADGSLLQIDPQQVNINASMSIIEQGQNAIKTDIPWGYAAIDNQAAPLVRLVLVACRNADGTPADTSVGGAADFCVLFYVSHVAGDGHTHYRLLSMFSSDQQIESLKATRTLGLNKLTTELLGHDPWGWMVGSAAHLLNFAFNGLLRTAPKYFTVYFDHEKVNELKSEALATSKGVPFVSTNDVMTSSLGRMIGARIVLLVVNFRDRVAGITDSHAGNYESVLLFDPGVYNSPVGIRKALNAISEKAAVSEGVDKSNVPVVCLTEALPSAFRFMSDRYALLTNWSTFHKGVVVPGCEEVLHAPGGDFKSMLPYVPYDTIVVYRATAGQLAALIFSKNFSEEDYLREMPMKEYVAP